MHALQNSVQVKKTGSQNSLRHCKKLKLKKIWKNKPKN